MKKYTVIRRVINIVYLYSFDLGKNRNGSYYSICFVTRFKEDE